MGSRHELARSSLAAALCVLSLVAGLIGPVETAAAQAPDLRDIRPFMMLVVDTSGSMERLPKCVCSTPSCSECLPDCNLPNDGAGMPPVNKKNRWAVTLEALTGTINDFECERLDRTAANGMSYDVAYYLPYHQPWDCSTGNACKAYPSSGTSYARLDQVSDGVIDAYRGRVRFGLMTFDGWDTYLGKGPLVAASQYQYTLGEAEGGLWSYGSFTSSGAVITRKDGSIPGRFHYPNCATDYQMDTGVRGPQANEGKLVSLDSCTTPPCDSAVLNDDIQKALIDTRPYGGTPIAASLDDLYYHLTVDLNDSYGTCRGRYGLLITDGYPDDDYRSFGCDCTQNTDPTAPGYCGGGSSNDPANMMCPYPKPEDVAYDLITGRGDADTSGTSTKDNPPLEKLIVVGLSITDNAVKDRLNLIAQQGGSDQDTATGNYALFADDLTNLKVTLDSVVGGTLAPISRAVPAFVNGSLGAGAAQYQLTAGFELATDVGQPWTGILERKRYICGGNPDGETIDASDRFQDLLNSQARTLYSVLPSSSDPEETVDGRASGTACGVTGCPLVDLSDGGTFSPTVLAVASDAERQDVVNWMYGTGPVAGDVNPRANKKLGDIYHSSPVITTGPLYDRADPAFNAFRQRPLFSSAPTGPRIAERPPVAFVNSNDGIIHAFLVDDFNGPISRAGGDELWGFVPPLLLNDLKNNLNLHQFTMDGTPVVKDVYFQRNLNNTISDGREYHTVLITGMRGGGNAYVALDVTNPFQPEFLWQFTDDEMGKTYGRPVIGQARFRFISGGTSSVQDRAIAILPGGQGTLDPLGVSPGCVPLGLSFGGSAFLSVLGGQLAQTETDPDALGATHKHRGNVRCWEKTGRTLYFVDVETGQLIKKLDASVFPSPVIGTPALYSDEVGTAASRAFVMDADGVMWRIDMTNPGAATGSEFDPIATDPKRGWTARPFHDFFFDLGYNKGEVSYEPPVISTDDVGRLVILAATGDTDNFEKTTAENRVVSLTEVEYKTPVTSVEDYRAAFNWEHRVNGNPDGLVPSELVTGKMVLASGQLFYASFISVSGGNACDSGKGRLWSVHYKDRELTHPNMVSPPTYGPRFIDVLDSGGTVNPLFNTTVTNAADNLLIMGLALNERPACEVVNPQTDTLANFGNYGAIASSTPPSRYLTAQASGGSDAVNLSAASLTSVEVEVRRPEPEVKVMSWATPVE